MLRSFTQNVSLMARALIGKGNESLQDQNDILLMEQEIKDARKVIASTEDELINSRASVSLKSRELDGYHSRRQNLEDERTTFRSDYEKAIEAGNPERAEKCKQFAMKIKGKLTALDNEFKHQIEDHELSVQMVNELEATINLKNSDIERAESAIKTAKQRESMIALHEKTASISDGVDGINIENSALSRINQRQEVAQERIRQRTARKKVQSTSLEDDIASFRSSENADDPWN